MSTVTLHIHVNGWLTGVVNFVHQVVLLRIFLQLVSHCPHNVLNLGLEQLLQRVDRDVWRLFLVHLLQFLLLV